MRERVLTRIENYLAELCSVYGILATTAEEVWTTLERRFAGPYVHG